MDTASSPPLLRAMTDPLKLGESFIFVKLEGYMYTPSEDKI